MRAKTTMLCTSQHLISLTISIHQMISIFTHQYGIQMSPFSPPMLHSNRSFSQNETCGTFCCLNCYLLFIDHIRVVRSQQNKRNENLTSLDIYFQLIKKKNLQHASRQSRMWKCCSLATYIHIWLYSRVLTREITKIFYAKYRILHSSQINTE